MGVAIQRGGEVRQLALRRGARLAVPAIFIVLFLLSGCAGKVKVVYAPSEKRTQPVAKTTENTETIALLKKHYEKWKGTPYADGGMSAAGLDCSGFTVLAYRSVFGLRLPRTAGEQAAYGQEVAREDLAPGDLVFFQTGTSKRHVGIYLADDQFIHASLSRGVTISSLDDGYWQKKYWMARRLSNQVSLNGGLGLANNYR